MTMLEQIYKQLIKSIKIMKNNIEVRSTIVIKVKKEDIGKSIKSDIIKNSLKIMRNVK